MKVRRLDDYYVFRVSVGGTKNGMHFGTSYEVLANSPSYALRVAKQKARNEGIKDITVDICREFTTIVRHGVVADSFLVDTKTLEGIVEILK